MYHFSVTEFLGRFKHLVNEPQAHILWYFSLIYLKPAPFRWVGFSHTFAVPFEGHFTFFSVLPWCYSRKSCSQ